MTTPLETLRRLEPFVVSAGWRFEQLDLKALGTTIAIENRFDVLCCRARGMLGRLIRLDRLTFGPEGMPMPERLFVDASALPGVITGLGLRATAVPEHILDRLDMRCSPDDLVPLAMYIAVPVRPPHVWYGHNLASLNRLVPELELRGLATATKALGLAVMRCTEQLGATQWTSPALHVHTRFGPLELLTAWTPAHADSATLTYRLRLTDQLLVDVVSGTARRVDMVESELTWVEPFDMRTIRLLEGRIERGERLAVVGPPDGNGCVPVATLSFDQEAPAGAPARCAPDSPPGPTPPNEAHQ